MSISVETENISTMPIKDTSKKIYADVPHKLEIAYFNAALLLYFHLAGVYGFYITLTSAKRETILLNVLWHFLSMIGLTAGAHRLWSHRSYKAKPILQAILMICQSTAFQCSAIWWARDHRVHHKYTETDADPSNPRRGFFFAHIGWLLVRKHPEVIRRGKEMDMSDLENNPILKFQNKYWKILLPFLAFVIPTYISTVFWEESLSNAWYVGTLRYIISLNSTFLINSVAHTWGWKPYDKYKTATQSIPTCLIAFGEGYHNYHHVFPSDYRAGEYSNSKYNFAKLVIDLFALIGWAYDMKTVPEDTIRRRMEKTGDGSSSWGL